MTRYEALLIRAALVWLVVTGVLGALFFVHPPWVAWFRTVHVHVGVIGFFLSMVMGVAFWMMPRPGQIRQDELEALTFWLLHGGLSLRIVAEPWWRISGADLPQALAVASGVLLLAAIVVFAWAMQARVKTREEIVQLRMERERIASGSSTPRS